MYSQSRSTAYRDNEVLTASRERLVLLLYEGLLKNLRRAGKQIGVGDFEGKSESLGKASAILFELMGALDFEAGGEVATRLSALYAYFASEILEVGRTLSLTRLDALVGLIANLHAAWSEAAQKVVNGAPAGAVES